MNTHTLLEILPHEGGDSIGFNHWAARGIRHTLRPVDRVVSWRTPATGALKTRTIPGTRKYALELSASDVQPPDFGGLWRGMTFTVHAGTELSYTALRPAERPSVAGSVRTVTGPDGHAIHFYRPVLTMAVLDWNDAFAEWEAGQEWSLSLEEV